MQEKYDLIGSKLFFQTQISNFKKITKQLQLVLKLSYNHIFTELFYNLSALRRPRTPIMNFYDKSQLKIEKIKVCSKIITKIIKSWSLRVGKSFS